MHWRTCIISCLPPGKNDFSTVAEGSYLGKAALNSDTDWNSFIAGSFDDAQWCILALWKIADYKVSRHQDSSAYSNAASAIYDIISKQWDDTTCGGGVWWSSEKTYKNAITNQLFLLTSAVGYLRTRNETYLTNANKEWTWLNSSGMRNSDGLYNDGLDSAIPDACKNNGMTTWTYNQGVIASGLAALSVANGDLSLLSQAEITLDAAIAKLTANNILKESCDDAAPGGTQCNRDQQSFKGIWTKHLQYYLDAANDTTRISKYSTFLGSQYSAVVSNGTDWRNDIGSVWYGANQGGSIFSPQTSASGLACAIAAAKYGQAC